MSQGKAFSFAGNANSGVDPNGRTIFTADGHRDDGKRFVLHADEKSSRYASLMREPLE